MGHSRNTRPRALRKALLAVASVTLLGGIVVAVTGGSALAASRGVDYKRACAVPKNLGDASCFALISTKKSSKSEAAFSGAVPTGYGYGPSQLQSAYNLKSASASKGAGKIVAVVDAYNDPNAVSDLATYRSSWGEAACNTSTGDGCLTVVNQNGATSPLPTDAGSTGWDVEESLDVDMVSAICPQCKIYLVEADSPTLSNLGTAVDSAVSVLHAGYVSNSYGGTDTSGDSSYDSDYDHAGVAVTASAGDDGYGASYPATSKWVTAVGGTTLKKASNSRGWTETVWGSSSGGEGTGSGCSVWETQATWQTDTLCGTYRTDNDVSADANPNTGVAVYDTYSQTGWLEVGGTSASSPMIASVFALAGTPKAGTYPASYIYSHTSDLYDVTKGSNGSCSPAALCKAQKGYDGPTGWGTPDGTKAFKG